MHTWQIHCSTAETLKTIIACRVSGAGFTALFKVLGWRIMAGEPSLTIKTSLVNAKTLRWHSAVATTLILRLKILPCGSRSRVASTKLLLIHRPHPYLIQISHTLPHINSISVLLNCVAKDDSRYNTLWVWFNYMITLIIFYIFSHANTSHVSSLLCNCPKIY